MLIRKQGLWIELLRKPTEEEKYKKNLTKEFNCTKGHKKGIGDIMEGARSVKGRNKSKRKIDKLKNLNLSLLRILTILSN